MVSGAGAQVGEELQLVLLVLQLTARELLQLVLLVLLELWLLDVVVRLLLEIWLIEE